jgi:hypothetical protein
LLQISPGSLAAYSHKPVAWFAFFAPTWSLTPLFPLNRRSPLFSKFNFLELAHNMTDIEEHLEGAKDERSRRILAIYIAALAGFLAVTSCLGTNADQDVANENIRASDTWAFYQAKNVRQTQYKIAAEGLELDLKTKELTPEARKNIEEMIQRYRTTIGRYESEPETGEGKKELIAAAKEHERLRDEADSKGPWFDTAEAALQIAIVLASVSAIVEVPWLLLLSGFVAAVGGVATLNGWLLLV